LEAVNIKKKLIILALLLTLAVTLCISTAAAATTTTSTTTVTATPAQLDKASESVQKFIKDNKRLPNYVTISNKQVTMPQFLYLLNTGVYNLNSKKTTSVSTKTVNNPTNPSQSVKSGTLTKAEYVKVAGNVKKFVDTNKRLPNYATTTKGNMRYESLIDAYTRIMVFYGDNKRLPNTVTVAPWTVQTTVTPSASYLKSTEDAPSDNPTIISLKNSIIKGKTTTKDKATAIFNWVRNYLSYSFYYNTNKTALGAYKDKTANCVDTTHLLVALTRAAGIYTRYVHGTCQFFSDNNWYGHVWAQVYVDGKWYNADAINDKNTFGTITNWNTTNYKPKSPQYYAELPF
jgi:transglutaminase-like putative cysteine protease